MTGQSAPRPILVIDGHPDPGLDHYCHALAQAYAEGARAAGHPVDVLRVAELDFPVLRSPEEWLHAPPLPAIAEAQARIARAAHVVIVYPLWLGDVPALLKAFLEQVMRPGFALAYGKRGLPRKLLGGRSARIIVTMGMPGFAYRLWFRAHSLKSLERNVLRLCGIAPVETTVIGGVDGEDARAGWLDRVRQLGRDGA